MIRKLGENAFPLTFVLPKNLPTSMIAHVLGDDPKETLRSKDVCGVFYEICCFTGEAKVLLTPFPRTHSHSHSHSLQDVDPRRKHSVSLSLRKFTCLDPPKTVVPSSATVRARFPLFSIAPPVD